MPYHDFPLERALTGIKAAGFDYVTWGTTHKESGGKEIPVVAPDADPKAAKELGKRCRDLGLQPVMMFSGIYPEASNALSVLKSRILQAAAAGIPEVLTFGHTKGGNRKLWVERLKELGPIARDQGVRIVVKQHGGETGTGAACAEIIREVNDEGIKVNYDAGNVMDYLRVDPLADILKCAEEIRSFCRTILGPLAESAQQDELRTLEEFLRAHGSVNAVARALFLHRNTVRQRLKRIGALTGADLEDADQRMQLYLAVLGQNALEKLAS